MAHRILFEQLLDLLDLTDKYPQKISLNEALCIRQETLGKEVKCTEPKMLYLHVLQLIMAYHPKCRANILEAQGDIDNLATSDEDEHDIFGDNIETESAIEIHPMDTILALLHCADDFLRQDLMARLATCQLSIPFILPDPITGNAVFLLWAMKSITREWKSTMKGTEVVHNCSLVSYAIPMVAFVRFSKQGTSKSKIMNYVLSGSDEKYFFHRDCDGGKFDRVLGDGLVDISWYLPAGEEHDVFPEAIAFVNLHGDARNHTKQVDFLSKTCFMTFAIFSNNDFDKKSASLIKQLSLTPGGIVLLCTEPLSSQNLRGLQQDIKKSKLAGCRLANMSPDKIKAEVRARIKTKLVSCTEDLKELQAVMNVKSIAIECGLDIDEKEGCIKGQELAHMLHSMMIEQGIFTKERLLPLQGENLWQAWAKLDKEEHRPNSVGGTNDEDFMYEKKKEKDRLREQQLQLVVETFDQLMKHFISKLSESSDVSEYFFQTLKLLLAHSSRENVTKFHQQYMEKRKLKRELKENDDQFSICKKEMDSLQKNMIKASLGIEHLLREVCQIYEATCQSHVKEKYCSLPKSAAKFFVSGKPLELMDGEAAYVPIDWIKKVLLEAKEMLDDPRVFVVSVLGLQSTGKSTLMNTTFGLRFNASAGRCTRGAFMQLIPLNESLRKDANCDYLLIVDTEGLRAPELNPDETRQHDNELATFVVGLANLTIINIYGEVLGAMDDILQTTVHALIRMKSVKLTPGCQFVHQNVAAISAGEMGEMGRSNFTDKLDSMTRLVAKEENCDDKHRTFNDVIAFDTSRDVHHFPGLWLGAPPMAPVNEKYSNKALWLKSQIVKKLLHSCPHLRLSEVSNRIKDLWDALLEENFVFSFKNTVEAAAYSRLDAQFNQWRRKFQMEMCKWQDAKELELKSIEEATEINSSQRKTVLTEELTGHALSVHGEIKKEMEKFFDGDQKHVLVQWKENTERRLLDLKDNLQQYSQSLINQVVDGLEDMIEKKSTNSSFREQIRQKVKALVNLLDKEQLNKKKENNSETEEYLRKKFEDEWPVWMCQLREKDSEASKGKVKKLTDSIIVSIHDALCVQFKTELSKVQSRLPLTKWGKRLELEEEPSHEHFVFKQGLQDFVKKVAGNLTLTREHKNVARTTAAEACTQVDLYLDKIKDKTFHSTFITEILNTVDQVITAGSSGHTDFAFTTDYRIVVSLTVCGYALSKFQAMAVEFIRRNSPIHHLETKSKEFFFSCFKDDYFQTVMEKRAACTICKLLKDAIKNKALKPLREELYRGMQCHMPYFRLSFNWRSKDMLSDWASRELRSEMRKLKMEIERMEGEFTTDFDSVKWLHDLCAACALYIDASELESYGGKQIIKDKASFLMEITGGVDALETSLTATFRVNVLDELLYRRLWS